MQSWRDDRLTWDPTDFGDVEYLRFSADRLWKPDLRLYNALVKLCVQHKV